MTVLTVAILGFWFICNILVSRTMTVEEMREDFITDQNPVGRVCANSFYSLAWLLKKVLK